MRAVDKYPLRWRDQLSHGNSCSVSPILRLEWNRDGIALAIGASEYLPACGGGTRRSESELRTRDWGRGTVVMFSGFRGSRATGRTPTPRRPNNRAAT